MMRTLTVRCDRCGEVTASPSVVAIEAAPGPRPGPFDLCPRCAAGLADWLKGPAPSGEDRDAVVGNGRPSR